MNTLFLIMKSSKEEYHVRGRGSHLMRVVVSLASRGAHRRHRSAFIDSLSPQMIRAGSVFSACGVQGASRYEQIDLFIAFKDPESSKKDSFSDKGLDFSHYEVSSSSYEDTSEQHQVSRLATFCHYLRNAVTTALKSASAWPFCRAFLKDSLEAAATGMLTSSCSIHRARTRPPHIHMPTAIQHELPHRT